MKTIMNLLVVCLFLTSCVQKTTQVRIDDEACNLELFITPRNLDYGFIDLGVYRYKLTRQNVVVPFSDKSYNPKMIRSYANEYCYIRKVFDGEYFDTAGAEEVLGTPRILAVLCSNDTIKIDANYTSSYRDMLYKCSPKFVDFLQSSMPEDIRENWVYDLSTSGIDDPAVTKIPR